MTDERPTPQLIWVSTKDRKCGIADYSRVLFTAVESRFSGKSTWISLDSVQDWGIRGALSELLFGTLSKKAAAKILGAITAGNGPAIIHVQHEYGIWGGKNPPGYFFSNCVAQVKAATPHELKWVATSHTVLGPDYKFPLKSGTFLDLLQRPVRLLLNQVGLGYLKKVWGEKTWGPMDVVICHSHYQKSPLQLMGAKRVEVIPHFVAEPSSNSKGLPGTVARGPVAVPMPKELTAPRLHSKKWIVVFGFFTPEKGQDIAIEALRILSQRSEYNGEFHLVLAGGVRRGQDRAYYDQCRQLIRDYELSEHITVTGFLDVKFLDGVFARAHAVVVPFRETSGSGSVTQGLARGVRLIASDLPINRELSERVPGCMTYFKAEDPHSLAQAILDLEKDERSGEVQKSAALAYSKQYSVSAMAEMTVQLYEKKMDSVVKL